MTRNDHHTPFDRDVDERRGDDLAEEFWGPEPGWRRRTSAAERGDRHDDTTGSIRAIRAGVAAFRPQRVELRDATGQVQRTRSHGTHPPVAPAPVWPEATLGQLASGEVADHEFSDEVPLEPTRAGVVGFDAIDPLLVRMGVLLLVGALLVPLALALRPGGDASATVSLGAPVAAAASGSPAGGSDDAPTPAGSVSAPASTEGAASDVAGDATTSSATDASSDSATGDTSATVQSSEAPLESAPTAAVGDVTQGASPGLSDAATVDAAAERIVPSCPQTYTAAGGDSWYRIAEAADVAPSALLDQNNATLETVILPGDDICLPEGATMPSPPPSTTDAPSTTNAPTTTDAPTATTAPTAVSGSPGRNASVAEVKDVIRSIFPESEWETAFTIAERESRFVPTAYNGWCCYGVFQIYWSVHKSWLDDLGIDSSSDLFDPLLNVRAAHTLWERAGNSWSPWSTYDG